MTRPSQGDASAVPGAVTSYARRIGLFGASMAVIGGIIGGGIFRTPAPVAERLHSTGMIHGVWALGGLIALLGAFCFGELAARRPRAGGGYVYLRETLGPLPAFLYGWTLLLVIATGAIAAVGVTFADYLRAFAGLGPAWTVPLAIGAIVFLSAINYRGVHLGATTQNVFTILKLLGIAALVVAGAFLAGAGAPALASSLPASSDQGTWSMVRLVGMALVPVLFTYGGWQQTNFIAEEVTDAERTLPRALVIGVAGVTVTYLLANLTYLRVLGVEGLSVSTAPAADVMTQLFGSRGGGIFISAVIAISAFGFLNLVILATPRVFQAMAADGLFLPALARLHPRYRTPGAAILVQGGWAIVLTLSGTFSQLVDYVTFGDWIFFGLTVSGLFIYRGRDGVREGTVRHSGFRVPGYPVTPVLFIGACLWVVAGSVSANPGNAMIGAGLIALGVPVYWMRRRA